MPSAAAAKPVLISSLPRSPAGRLVSLDAFRGITIAGMILVNNPGDWSAVYPPLEHAAWNSWTPADLIFPCFLFIVGVAITLSLPPRSTTGADRMRLAAKVLRRAALIFALGLFLNAFPDMDWTVLRIPGVLQRVALCYAGAALVVLTTGTRGQAITAVSLLVGYWALMTLVPSPDASGTVMAPYGNWAAYLDRNLLSGHLLYDDWDPEGLLSTLPALATTLIGVMAGSWLRSPRDASERTAGLLIGGTIGVATGLLLGLWFPINKNLWSSPYAIFSAGVALIVLAACVWLIDVRGYRRGLMPFVAFGMNPIVAYVLSSLTTKIMLLWMVTQADDIRIPLQEYLFTRLFLPIASPTNASLLYATVYTLVWLGIAGVLYRTGIFIKV